MNSCGICGNVLSWIEAFLCGRTQSVRIGEAISAPIPVISGVPQESVLGPTLFLLYINDVGDIFNDVRVSLSLFADDLKLYTLYKLDASHNDLQVPVNRLDDWASLWQLQIAIPKCTTYQYI